MKNFRIIIVLSFSIIIFTACGCGFVKDGVHLVDAKIAVSVDENLMPVETTDVFPKNTSKVSCWLKWRDTKINTQLMTSWHYVTDDVHIIDYSFVIPRKEGAGSVVLSMPDGKNLPSGQYKVDLLFGKRVLKSLKFRIE